MGAKFYKKEVQGAKEINLRSIPWSAGAADAGRDRTRLLRNDLETEDVTRAWGGDVAVISRRGNNKVQRWKGVWWIRG